MAVEVEAAIREDGRVNVRRIRLDGRWQAVEQGRQWRDDEGRHVLIMLNNRVHELLLSAETLRWELHSRTGNHTIV